MTSIINSKKILAGATAAASLLVITACGDKGAEAAAPPTPAKAAAAPPKKPAPAPASVEWPHIPPEWLKNQGLLANGNGLEYFATYLFMQPDRLDDPKIMAQVTRLYSCADGERAANNEVERAAIYQRYREKLRAFHATAPSTFTLTIGKSLGKWSAEQGAIQWQDDIGQSSPVAIPLTRIPPDPESLYAHCGAYYTVQLWAPALRTHYTELPPLKMAPEQASKIFDRLGDSRFVHIKLVFDLKPTRAPDPKATAPLPNDSRIDRTYEGRVPMDGYFRSAVVTTTRGVELARF